MAKDKIEKKLLHIEVKDNGLILSQKIGRDLTDIKSKLEQGIINNLISGSDTNSITRYKIAQNNNLRAFRSETHKVIDSTKKSVKNALKSDTTVNLKETQVNKMSKQIDKGLLFLEKSAVNTYQSTLNSLFLQVKSAVDLKEQLQKHINSGLNVGVVYQNGREYKFDTYFEMKTRTDIQQDIGKNMIEAGHAGGVIFYIAAFFGDCAKDHVDYQGKIYCDPDWEALAPKDRIEEIREYIKSNKIMSVKEVMEEPYYFTTRPNCRHYFQYVDIDSVLGAKNEKQVSNLRDNMNLNFNGKYKPEKYKALQEQRTNERMIRAKKNEVTKLEQSLALDVGNQKLRSQIMAGEESIKYYQAKQRLLERKYDNINRSYMREQVGNRVDFNVSKNLTNKSNNANIEMVSGGVYGALDRYSREAEKHATVYYDEIRKMKNDVNKISENLSMPLDKVKEIKEYVFYQEHDLFDGRQRFDPNYDMAVAWQRLIGDKTKIRESDKVLLEHEYLECQYMKQGLSYEEAHIRANKKYNWWKTLQEEEDNGKDNKS